MRLVNSPGEFTCRLAGILAIAVFAAGIASPQAQRAKSSSQSAILTSRSNVVLVPALVKDKSGEVVFSLTAGDFILTDNGVIQPLQIEADTDSEPIAVAVIAFDSAPRLQLGFTPSTDAAAKAIANLQAGDSGAAILDALNFGIDALRRQPPEYRRAILLFSETADSSSRTSLENVLREVDDTNTAIYSFAFSSTKAAVAHEAQKLPRPGGSPYEDVPYGKGGCMSRGSDPDAHGNRGVQALDCASDLFPPLRLVRMAFLSAREGLRRNVPQTVARLTGGEYFPFKNSSSLARDLLTVSNDVPNYYVLSFSPASPSPGFHDLKLTVKDRPELIVKARDAYWVDEDPRVNPKTR